MEFGFLDFRRFCVKGQRSKVKGQRSKVKGQRSKVKGQRTKKITLNEQIGWENLAELVFLLLPFGLLE
ncbi:MAG: hypothetical protein AAGM40_30760 [Cyanobacteria bacterium J06573_2]